MRHSQRVASVLMLLAASFASVEVSAQGITDPNSTPEGQTAPIDYDGGTGLLKLEQIQQELKLDTDQVEQVLAILRDTTDQMRDLYSGLGNLTEEERKAEFETLNKKIKAIAQSTLAKIKEVLQPEQLERLNQLKMQLLLRRGGGLVGANALSNLLGLSDAEKTLLRQREQQVAEELRAKIAQLRQEARGQILDALTPEQRAQLDQLLGQPFDFQWGQPAFGN